MLSGSLNKADADWASGNSYVNGYVSKPLTENKIKELMAKHFPYN